MQQIQCPHCGAAMSLPENLAGQRVACVSCRAEFVAPGPSAAGSPAPGAVPSAPPSAPAMAYPQAPGAGPPTNGKAIASMVLGIAAIATCCAYGIPSVVCGILAVVFAKSAQQQIQTGLFSPGSAGMIKAGRICGWIGIGISVLIWIVLIIAFAFSMSQGRSSSSPPWMR